MHDRLPRRIERRDRLRSLLDDLAEQIARCRGRSPRESRTGSRRRSAVPKAAPTERENCTMAAPVPSSRGPDTACTVTWTTPITVPMNSAMVQKTQASSPWLRCGIQKARNKRLTVAAISPQVGNTAVYPVRVTNLPGDHRADADAGGERQQDQAGFGPAWRRAPRADRSAGM